MTKLEKIDKELSKAREKAAEWQTKIRDLEKQRQEEENSMIVQAVRFDCRPVFFYLHERHSLRPE